MLPSTPLLNPSGLLSVPQTGESLIFPLEDPRTSPSVLSPLPVTLPPDCHTAGLSLHLCPYLNFAYSGKPSPTTCSEVTFSHLSCLLFLQSHSPLNDTLHLYYFCVIGLLHSTVSCMKAGGRQGLSAVFQAVALTPSTVKFWQGGGR